MKYKTKNLIIFDWDDTLFPTTWVMKNSISLTQISPDYQDYFNSLDEIVAKTLNSVGKNVIIVTNASASWVIKCVRIMPSTKKVIKNIKIFSSREMFQKEYPFDNYVWKKLFFEYIVNKFYLYRNYKQNIVSIGDAEYEYFALINLYAQSIIGNGNSNSAENINKEIKTIKLIRYPTKEELIGQVNILCSVLPKIINRTGNIDLHLLINKEN